MPNLDQALGLHPQAISLRAQRAGILAANLANADTPGYRARDVDFSAILAGESAAAMRASSARHLGPGARGMNAVDLQYRVPSQPSLDQNTVDVQAERARFAENTIRYQASLRFLDGKVSSLISAFKGE